jgi:maltooligosyltrehalose trehalohydrolase
VPDPQSDETFRRSRLNHDLRHEGQHRLLYELHQELIRLRTSLPALATLSKERLAAQSLTAANVLLVHHWHADDAVVALFYFGSEPATLSLDIPAGTWQKVLDTADDRWQITQAGAATTLPGHLESRGSVSLTLAPHMCALFQRQP